MYILGIESSCDDTSVSLIDATDEGFVIIAEKTASQIDIHKKYGGVIPEVAARAHAEYILPLIEEVLQGKKPDAIAVTSGPGLMTALIVGVEAGRTLSYLWNIPLVGVNHIEGHIHSVEASPEARIEFPGLALIVSGGHTELIYIPKQGVYQKIGKTLDDASGECFDKVAKLLKLEYPGGPKISKMAVEGNPKIIAFPRPMMKEDNFDFSFSGLKTSVLYWLRDNPEFQESSVSMNDFCASFEQAIVDVLVHKTIKAVESYHPKTVILGGGVSANKKLRETLQTQLMGISEKTPLLVPEIRYAMDNATMIAIAGYYKAKKQEFTSWNTLKADPQWELGES